MDEWTDRKIDRQTDGRTDTQTDGRMDSRRDRELFAEDFAWARIFQASLTIAGEALS